MLGVTDLPFDGTVSLKGNQSTLRNTASFPSHPCLHETCSIGTNLFLGCFKNCLSKAHFTKLDFNLRDVQMLMAGFQMLNVLFFGKKQVVFVLFCFFNSKRPE